MTRRRDTRMPASMAPSRPPLVTAPFLLVVASGLGFFGSVGTIVPLLPRYVEEKLGQGNVAIGVVVGAFAVSAVVSRPLAGRLNDSRGRRFPMRVGAFLTFLSISLYGLAPNVFALVGLRLVTGVGDAMFFVGAITLINDLAPAERRGEAVSYFSIAVYLGIGLGPSLGELLHSHVRFSLAFLVAGLLALVALGSTRFVPRGTPPPRPTHAEKRRLVHPAALAPGFVLALGLMGFTGFQAFVPLYIERFGTGAGALFLLYAGIVLATRLLGARLPDTYGAGSIATFAFVLIAIGLATTAAWASLSGLYIGTAVLGVGMALQYPALISLAVSRAPEHDRAAVLGTFTAFFDLASGVGGPVLGVAASIGGYRGAFATGSALAVAALVMNRILFGGGRGGSEKVRGTVVLEH